MVGMTADKLADVRASRLAAIQGDTALAKAFEPYSPRETAYLLSIAEALDKSVVLDEPLESGPDQIHMLLCLEGTVTVEDLDGIRYEISGGQWFLSSADKTLLRAIYPGRRCSCLHWDPAIIHQIAIEQSGLVERIQSTSSALPNEALEKA